jgi:drug/metabolite transporter (DMT)-like permease
MLFAATLLILPAALILERPWTVSAGWLSLGALLALAFFSTAVAFVVWFRLIQTAGPSNTSLVTFVIPFTALALGVLILGEQPSRSALLGLLIILVGLAITQLRAFRGSLTQPSA